MDDLEGILSVSAVNVAVMTLDDRDVAWLVASQRGVLSRAQTLACGITANGVQYRIRPGGPWQRLLPGIYVTTTGEPSRDQLLMAALVYAGPASMITGPAALPIYSIRPPKARIVDVLVPASRQRASRGFVAIHRTHRMPRGFTVDGGLRFAPAGRAVADAARGLAVLSEARAVVASAVQQHRCTIHDLCVELTNGPIRDSARLRAVLAEVIDGIRSVPEGDFRVLIQKSGLPLPIFNPQLFLNGEFLATPDAWWPDAGVIVEIDSREWHFSAEDWEKTLRRHARVSATGIIVLHITPRQLRTEPDRVLRDLANALRAGRPVQGITTRPAAA
ncbi:MAG: hypothetical protein ACLQFR_01820 [Streptosporangiaceae bacterium]